MGSGKWGVGKRHYFRSPTPHSPLPTPHSPDAMQSQISVEGIRAAGEVVYGALRPTPLIEYPMLTREIGARVFLKHENHQITGAFKVRGGLNFMSHFARERSHDGVITATRGNHGQSVALAASVYSIPATIVVPFGNNPEKN